MHHSFSRLRPRGLLASVTLFSSFALVAQVTFVKTDGVGDGSSWSAATGDLSAVLATAEAGRQIWVAAGTYTPTRCDACSPADRGRAFAIPPGVAVLGGFAGSEDSASQRMSGGAPTVLSGDIDGDGTPAANSFHVVRVELGGADTRLDNLTIAHGNADGPSGYDSGAGLTIGNGEAGARVEPTITDCRFVANVSTGAGGAVVVDGREGRAAPAFARCSFVDNAGREGGAVWNQAYRGEASPTFDACLFEGNVGGAGGAVYSNGVEGITAAEYRDCGFFDNLSRSYGGAVYNFGKESGGACRAVFANCVFDANRGEGAAGAVYNLASTGGEVRTRMVGCAFRANTSDVGGAVYVNGSDGSCRLEIANSIFTESSAGYDPVVHFSGNARPEVYLAYCQVDADGPGDILEHEAGDLIVGPGMLYADDAGFRYPDARDFRLESTAPGVDAGSDSAYAALAVTRDLGDGPRVQGPRADVGPHESPDVDGDGVPDEVDNCPTITNADQSDADADGFGVACDCDDGDPGVNPASAETCDGRDEDCDGEVDEDVIDVTSPTVACVDTTLVLRPGDSLALRASVLFAGGTDDCGEVSPVAVDPPTLFELGEVETIVTAADAAGNRASCVAVVTVVDAGSLEVEACPADRALVAASGDSVLATWESPAIASSCTVGGLEVRQVSGPRSGDRLAVGVYRIAYELSDACGNVDSCAFRLVVAAAPVSLNLSCPDIDTFRIADPDSSAVVAWMDPETSSDCPGGAVVEQVSGPTSGVSLPEGALEIVYVARDSCGNVDTCRFELVVVAPAETAPPDNSSAVEERAPRKSPSLHIVPNPSAGPFHLTASGRLERIRVLSASGRLVHEAQSGGHREVSVDLSHLPPGLYSIVGRLRSGDRVAGRVVLR